VCGRVRAGAVASGERRALITRFESWQGWVCEMMHMLTCVPTLSRTKYGLLKGLVIVVPVLFLWGGVAFRCAIIGRLSLAAEPPFVLVPAGGF
jgi:hypothetical protein